MARRKSILGILIGGSSKRRSSRSRKSGGFFGTLLKEQSKTERRNVPCSKRKKSLWPF